MYHRSKKRKVVDSYILHFEKIAKNLKWPKEYWTLLLQSVLIDRARSYRTGGITHTSNPALKDQNDNVFVEQRLSLCLSASPNVSVTVSLWLLFSHVRLIQLLSTGLCPNDSEPSLGLCPNDSEPSLHLLLFS